MMARVVMSCEPFLETMSFLLLTLARSSTKLDAEKRLALQEEKQSLVARLLEVCVHEFFTGGDVR